MVSVRVIASRAEFDESCRALADGTGPLAIDAERASGFTYSQRAYLIQIHRRNAGTFLFDPPAIGDMSALTPLGHNTDWVLHAASQDLSSLREVGIVPEKIFDTELSARLLGIERVGLGAVLAEILDIHLAKEHSAANWSTRPLPESWLSYAASDVDHLVDLRDALEERLIADGKDLIAREEFESVLNRPDKPASDEPWRRLSGLHALKNSRQLAVARALWLSRDALARERDIAPGRLIPDASIVAAAGATIGSRADLAKLRAFIGRASRPELDRWWTALSEGLSTPELPATRVASDSIPQQRSWPEKNPAAAERLSAARILVAECADEMHMPIENLISPAPLREVCWAPPAIISQESLTAALISFGVRSWQAARVAPLLERAFLLPVAEISEASDDPAT